MSVVAPKAVSIVLSGGSLLCQNLDHRLHGCFDLTNDDLQGNGKHKEDKVKACDRTVRSKREVDTENDTSLSLICMGVQQQYTELGHGCRKQGRIGTPQQSERSNSTYTSDDASSNDLSKPPNFLYAEWSEDVGTIWLFKRLLSMECYHDCCSDHSLGPGVTRRVVLSRTFDAGRASRTWQWIPEYHVVQM